VKEGTKAKRANTLGMEEGQGDENKECSYLGDNTTEFRGYSSKDGIEG